MGNWVLIDISEERVRGLEGSWGELLKFGFDFEEEGNFGGWGWENMGLF